MNKADRYKELRDELAVIQWSHCDDVTKTKVRRTSIIDFSEKEVSQIVKEFCLYPEESEAVLASIVAGLAGRVLLKAAERLEEVDLRKPKRLL